MKFPLAISPCPNDCFLFHAWIHGLIASDIRIDPYFEDVQTLNSLARKHTFPILKVSMHCLGFIAPYYSLLPVGCALGYNCGPKIVSKNPCTLSQLSTKRVAFPGKETTAHLLYDTLAPKPKEKLFCLYHEMTSYLEKDLADCAVIIHESRFTFEKAGFYEVADLGSLWHQQFSLPLPLGGIVIQKDLPSSLVQDSLKALKDSLEFAHLNRQASLSFILEHSQEKDSQLIEAFLSLYVNDETHGLSAKGIQAIDTLLSCGVACGHYPKTKWTLV